MNTPLRLSALAVMGLSASLVGCGGKLGADQSHCQSICDWAVECAAAEDSSVDTAALLSECLAAAEAAAPSCADLDAGNLDKDQELLIGDCNDAIADKASAGECDAFTGTIAEAELAILPSTCNAVDDADAAFSAAQESVQPGSEELCVDVADTFCSKMSGCIDETTGFDAGAVSELPYDACMSALDGWVSSCVSNDTYAADPTNTQRVGAEECLVGFDDVTCDDVLGGNMPGVCAAAFVNPADYATQIFDIAQQYATGG